MLLDASRPGKGRAQRRGDTAPELVIDVTLRLRVRPQRSVLPARYGRFLFLVRCLPRGLAFCRTGSGADEALFLAASLGVARTGSGRTQQSTIFRYDPVGDFSREYSRMRASCAGLGVCSSLDRKRTLRAESFGQKGRTAFMIQGFTPVRRTG